MTNQTQTHAKTDAAARKRRQRVQRGQRDEAAARAWSYDWSGVQKPSSSALVIPLLQAIERNGGAARPKDIYEVVADLAGVPDAVRSLEASFANGRRSNLWERQVRFARETAKHRGYLSTPTRGLWTLTDAGGDALGQVREGTAVTVFETANGTAWWARAETAVGLIEDDSVDLVFTSPVYPHITDKRRYGTMDVASWLDFHTDLAGEWRRCLKDTGSLIVNLGPTYVSGTPCQSPYMERFVLALLDRHGYHLADRLYWENTNRLPPMAWVAVRRVRVRPSVEPLFWFSKTPHPKADNRRVLVPYKDRDHWLGREKPRVRPSGYDMSGKSFNKDNGGRIPGTLVTASVSASNDAYRRRCRTAGLPLHPAVMPPEVADFAIRLTTEPGDLVYDPFFGSGITGAVAESLGRRWLGSERALKFLDGAQERFEPCEMAS